MVISSVPRGATFCRWDGTSLNSSLGVNLVLLGLILGLIGTFLDSLLGATCQYTGYSSQLGRVRHVCNVKYSKQRTHMSMSGLNEIGWPK